MQAGEPFIRYPCPEMRLIRGLQIIHQRPRRIGLDPCRIAHDPSHRCRPCQCQDHQPQPQPVGKADPGSIRGDHGGKGVDGRSKNTNPRAQEDHRNRHQRVISGRDHHRDQQAVKRQRFFGHPVGRPAKGEQRHEDGDHPHLAPLQPDHGTANARIDCARRGDHPDEPADDQHEQCDINRIGGIAVGVIKPGDRGQDHIDKALGIARRQGVGASDGHIFAQGLRRHPGVLARRDDPCQGCDRNDQHDQDRKGVGKVPAFGRGLCGHETGLSKANCPPGCGGQEFVGLNRWA